MTCAMERYEAARQIIEEGPCTSITTVATQVLCDYFRITPKTLRQWVLESRFPRALRFGRCNVWRLAEVRKHMQKMARA